jgi:hypothetical protein
MKKHFIAIAATLSVAAMPSHAFFGKLNEQLNKAMQQPAGGAPNMPGAANAGRTAPSANSFNAVCRTVLGAPFKEMPGVDPNVEVAKYFNVTADFDKLLLAGIGKNHQGSMVNVTQLTPDLYDKDVRSLADAFNANPSTPMLAQVIRYAEVGDNYTSDEKPSTRTESKTLLAMIMMQYPELAKNKAKINELLRDSSLNNSGLGIALLARAHLYGDYEQKNENSFSNYIGRASGNYQVRLADQTIVYAVEKMPNWNYRGQYISLMKQSQQMQADLQRQQNAVKSSDTNRRALLLMQEGEKIDQMTLDALNAGPKMAEIRAKGEFLKKQGSGEGNLIEVAAYQSEEAKKEIGRLLAANPTLNDEAKKKLQQANQKLVENLNFMKAITIEVALKFFNGELGETLNSGEKINKYFRDACAVGFRQVEFTKQAGVPAPALSQDQLTADLMK